MTCACTACTLISFGLLKNNRPSLSVSPMLCARVSDAVLDLKTVAANQLKEVDDEATEGALVGLDTGSGCELKTDVRILPTVSMGKGDLGKVVLILFVLVLAQHETHPNPLVMVVPSILVVGQ